MEVDSKEQKRKWKVLRETCNVLVHDFDDVVPSFAKEGNVHMSLMWGGGGGGEEGGSVHQESMQP